MRSTEGARTQKLAIRFTEAEKAEIEEMARQEDRKPSDFARLLILAHLRRKETVSE